jgi:hypothetical protein
MMESTGNDSDWSDGFPDDLEVVQLESDVVKQQWQEGKPFESVIAPKHPEKVQEDKLAAMRLLQEFKSRPILVNSGKFQDDPDHERDIGIDDPVDDKLERDSQ